HLWSGDEQPQAGTQREHQVMALSDTQVRQLRAKLDAKHVKTRKANGADLHYVEGWHVIAEANRIFGFDAWDRRTFASHCVWSGLSGSDHAAAYTARVRVSVGRETLLLCGRDRGRGKARHLPRVKRTSLPSKAPRPMPPSGRLPPSATRSVLPFMIATKSEFARAESTGRQNQSVHGSSARRPMQVKQASTSRASSSARYARQ